MVSTAAAATLRSVPFDETSNPVPSNLFQRLRINGTGQNNHNAGSNKNNNNNTSKLRSHLPPAPFRRRTESVNTIMSSNSMVENTSFDYNNSTVADVVIGSTGSYKAQTKLQHQTKEYNCWSPLEWLEKECPDDVVPKVLAFCGPQQVAALSKTNKHWNKVAHEEKTWRVMCEEMYKWKPTDPEPESWFDLYRYSPCVPIDYPSIPKALTVALEPPPFRTRRNNTPKQQQKQIRSVRILLRPGNYWLKQAIDIQAHPGVTILFKTVELPSNLYRPIYHASEITEQPLPLQPLEAEPTTRKRNPSFFNLFRCKRQSPSDETDLAEISDFTEDYRDNSGSSMPSTESKHATLILRSRRSNEPVFRVRQGILLVRNVEIQHNSLGLDIWNGNAAIQIQPPIGEDENPLPVEPLPVAYMDSVHISSQTGRGIVSIDGGKVVLRRCAVTDCAATGVYIGGPGSQAVIEKSDIIRNGVGNRIRRGIARGHSGIYLEQGFATIRNSNVSNNVLTGVSVVSPDNAFLVLENSTLVNNGTYQLELPPTGTISRQRSINVNNTMATRGEAPIRSGLTLTEPLPSSIVLYQHLNNQHTANAALTTNDV